MTNWLAHTCCQREIPVRQYCYYYCCNYCPNHETLNVSALREKQSILVSALWICNYVSTFSCYLSNSFQKMKHLFQGEKEASWGENKLFRKALFFSVHFRFFFFYFPDFNLSSSFLSFYPQYFRKFCFFFLSVSPSSLSEELSTISHTFTVFFFCYSFKAFLWMLVQRSHGTYYCKWRGGSKNRHIWNKGFREAVWWLGERILETERFAFEPRHCHLLAVYLPLWA